jgi:hypothetical protein
MESGLICLPQTNFFIVILIFVFLCIYYYYQFQQESSNINSVTSLQQEVTFLKQEVTTLNDINNTNKMNSITTQLQSVKQQPYNVGNSINNNSADSNGPSRQYVNNYNDTQNWLVVGYLYDNLNNRYVLYSRNLYPGNNNRKEYYTVDDSRNRIEIPFSTPNNKEIMDGDQVIVPTLTGTLTAKIYDIQQNKYNPNF